MLLIIVLLTVLTTTVLHYRLSFSALLKPNLGSSYIGVELNFPLRIFPIIRIPEGRQEGTGRIFVPTLTFCPFAQPASSSDSNQRHHRSYCQINTNPQINHLNVKHIKIQDEMSALHSMFVFLASARKVHDVLFPLYILVSINQYILSPLNLTLIDAD